MFFKFSKKIGNTGWLCFGLTLLLYVLLFQRRVLLDITAQVQTLVKVCEGEVAMPPTALFYVFTWLTALGQCDFVLLMGSAALTLAVFGWAKWWITRHIFEDYFGEKSNAFGWLALALAFVCSLPNADWWIRGYYIAGQPSPNYWMNGTLAVSFPFAIALFWQSYRQLQAPSPGWWRWELLWIVLLVLSKPSYLFVFGPVYAVFLLAMPYRKREVWFVHLAPLFVAVLLLALEYYLAFLYPGSVYVKDFNNGRVSGVAFRPLEVWRLYSSNIPLSILAAAVFPLGVAIMYWSELRHRLLFWYAWAGFGAAIAISAAFMQTGAEYYNWAFRFQQYIAAYLLFLVSVLFVWEKVRVNCNKLEGAKLQWSAVLFALHFISGLVYFGKMWWTKSYY